MTARAPDQSVKADGSTTEVDPESALQSVSRIVSSPEFSKAARLQSFLGYVVDEELAGRGSEIKAKTIAEDVYQRSLDQGNDPPAVVRVDAGRLRRRLNDYYRKSGKDDPLRIHIDPGGYRPRFEVREPEPKPPADKSPFARSGMTRWAVSAAAIVVVLAGGLILWSAWPGPTPTGLVSSPTRDAREALSTVSPRRLQAENLALEARDLMFPATDPRRLSAVLDLFGQVIDLDPNYFGGFAGAAQTQAILAINAMDPNTKADLLEKAAVNAQKALELAPNQGWSHSAVSAVAMAENDYDRAMEFAARSSRLSPNDRHVLSFEALVSLFGGDFEKALEVSNTLLQRDTSGTRSVYRNVAAAANYHLGNYAETIRVHGEAARRGDPVSAINLVYLAAAYARAGEADRADETVQLIKESWPEFPLEGFLFSLFGNPEHVRDILGPLPALR